MVTTYRVEVLRRNLQSQFQMGGQGYRWLDVVKAQMHLASVAEAPIRAGTLKAAHHSEIRGVNQWACRATISNWAEHAEWVHEGTPKAAPGTFIKGKMRVPKRRGNLRGAVLPKSQVFYTDGRFGRPRGVRGQDANPWMERACTEIAMGRGAIRYF